MSVEVMPCTLPGDHFTSYFLLPSFDSVMLGKEGGDEHQNNTKIIL